MYFSTVVAFAALPFLVGAVPVSFKSSRTKRPISIPLSKRFNFLNSDGIADPEKMQAGLNHASARFEQAFDAYERNTGGPQPLSLKRAHSNERRAFVETALSSANLMVTVDIEAGSPPKPYSVCLDTTIPDMFLGGNSCSTCSGKNRYDISISSTGTPVGSSSTTVNFGLGAVDGSVVKDSVFLGGSKVDNQTMLVATSITPSLQNFQLDGVVGLGLSQNSSLGGESYLESLIGSGGLSDAEAVLGLHLTPTGGDLIVGGTDTSKFKGDLVFINIDKPGLWQVSLDSIAINGTTVVTAKEAIIDTSGLFITGDNETITGIYSNIPDSARIPDSGTFQVPCDVKIPINIVLGGSTFELPDISTAIPLNKVISTADDNLCFGPYAVLGGISSSIIRIGVTFLDHFYIELDPVKQRVGLAPSIVGQTGIGQAPCQQFKGANCPNAPIDPNGTITQGPTNGVTAGNGTGN